MLANGGYLTGAGGPPGYSGLPLYGALRGGYLHTLITDEAAALGILRLFERDFHGPSSAAQQAGMDGR